MSLVKVGVVGLASHFSDKKKKPSQINETAVWVLVINASSLKAENPSFVMIKMGKPRIYRRSKESPLVGIVIPTVEEVVEAIAKRDKTRTFLVGAMH
ncbi:DUF6088 family protein [Dyadobacter tibetensis]|uniref:DUF6088 family protein n=1 Tax=Dyadobacter tibetensis TaxID=1211851 RepID=UPI00103A7C83|nr:DUF6088 family protein [Dyadobacter tibetensis]